MGDFFQGWRRKTGLALLAMLLTVVWFRGVGIHDRVAFDAFDTHHIICSSEGMLSWFRCVDSRIGKMEFQWTSVSLAPEDRQKTFMLDGDVIYFTNEKTWRTIGVGYRTGGDFGGGPYFRQWCVQYWIFVLPLTVVSAILLLIKPRPSKSAEEPKRA